MFQGGPSGLPGLCTLETSPDPLGEGLGYSQLWNQGPSTHCRGQLGILDCPLPISIFPLTHASAKNVFSNDDDDGNKTLLILQFSE